MEAGGNHQMQDDEILDHYDDMMQPYFDSREYACSQNIIDLLTEKLRHTLTPEQNTDLTRLLMAHIEDASRTAMEAFVTGVRNSGKIITPN